ncbi:MAG TPA: amidohydrolase [Clostridiaceae bacterium]|jgi:amidohydrolase|nr:amidohydrolase [Clostridiaceae bacterium]
MSVLLNEAKAMQDKLSWFRREIHKKPEVGMDLPITTAFVKEQLEKHGLKVDQIIDCGLSVLIEGGKPGKTILLRADMDALPLAEESGEEFASEFEGKSHGCGHDMHAASLIGTAILLDKHKDQIHGRVKLMWQPGEETFEGMKAMIAAGIMENPSLDAALDLHVDASSPVGVLNFSKGPFTTSADNYLMKIKGSGCHGSMPENSIDPLNVAVQIYNAIASMRFREIKSSEFLAMSICSISSGSSFNIIPDSVEMRGTMRTYNPAIRDYVVGRLEQITKEVSSLFRAEGSLEIVSSAPTISNDPEMVDKVLGYLEDFGMDFERDPSFRLPASDDFGYVARTVPSVMFFIGCKPDGLEKNLLHNPKVVFDERALPIASALMAHCAMKWLEEHA